MPKVGLCWLFNEDLQLQSAISVKKQLTLYL